MAMLLGGCMTMHDEDQGAVLWLPDCPEEAAAAAAAVARMHRYADHACESSAIAHLTIDAHLMVDEGICAEIICKVSRLRCLSINHLCGSSAASAAAARHRRCCKFSF